MNVETDAARDAAAKKLNTLSGRAQPQDEFMSVGGGETLTERGEVYKNPDRLVNKRTGQPVGGQQAQQAQSGASVPPPEKRTVGATSTVNGKTAVWNGVKWAPQ